MPSLSARARIAVLITLAIVVYLPALHLPFIADDYTQIPLARQFAAQGWTPLFHEVNLRARATYMVLSALLDRTFGFDPVAFYTSSILLHVLCVLLVYACGCWTELGEPAAFWAAAFFAIEEGHQEAVMWPAAAAELLVFLFGVAAWICWVRWLQGRQGKWYAAAVACFVLAAASKESVWVFPALMLLPVVPERRHWRRGLLGLIPFFAMAAVYVIWTWNARVADPAYHDTRFSLAAPWGQILLNSWWRLLLVWGLAAYGVLLWVGRREDRRLAAVSTLWMLLGLLPYCFLTYMRQVPSRQTYLASAGLAWLFGLAVVRLWEKQRYTVLAILCGLALMVNVEILWVKKISQFEERGQPTELLRQAAIDANGPVSIDCFPLPDFLAEAVVASARTTAVFEHPGLQQEPSCFAIEYHNKQGQVVHVTRRLGTAQHGAFY